MIVSYIDPGTGSMLFAILVSVFGVGIYSLRNLFIKLRFRMKGGKQEALADRIPLALFADGKQYWKVFEPICDELEARGQSAVYLTAAADDPGLKKEYAHVARRFIGEGNAAFAVLNTLKADVLLSSTPGLDVYQWKRSKDVGYYVHLPHASSDITLYRMFGLDYYDAVLLSGEYQVRQIRELERLRDLPEKELEIVGVPYLDEMAGRVEAFRKRERPTAAEKDNSDRYGTGTDGSAMDNEKKTTVLLAPSWGSSSMFSLYGERLLRALAETGYHVIVRPHPQSAVSEKELLDALRAQFPENEQMEWDFNSDNFDALRRADILISDFSGVIFDFAFAFDRPIVYSVKGFDKAPYDACWLEEELWIFDALPRMGVELKEEDLSDMKGLVDRCLFDESFKKGREAAGKETWMYRGEGARRTVDYLEKRMRRLGEAGDPGESAE